ncbi:YozE family protein [Duganella vulcania]|uniref:YozE SAM-like domain-containing protein n=1 Tax=Duganella vulcania TaxID=2692166 RepID=A0A845GH70_9BURK|nr:YozE family protein [Duganella vulcania]MYM92636.1 hypothetical protein [Duganella vulcania]
MKISIEIPDTPELAAITHDEMKSIIERAMAFTHDRDDGSQIDIAGTKATVIVSPWMDRPSRSFRAWLKTQSGRDDFVGDLAKDAVMDKASPGGRATKLEWRRHIVAAVGENTGALSALDEAWAEFLKA